MTQSRRVPRGTSVVGIQVVGLERLQRAFRPLLEPELTRHLDAANKQAAQGLAKELRKEVRPASKRMARAVRVRRAKTGKPDWIVGSRRKVAFFWPWVIRGTRAHGPRRAKALHFQVGGQWVTTQRVAGVKANPAVDRVAQRHGKRAVEDAGRQFKQDVGL